jgi:predicted Ser/Thr protein kinase
VGTGKDDDQVPADPLGPTHTPSSGGSGKPAHRSGGSWRTGEDGATPSGSFWVGRVLGGRWEVKERIGSGGMATVHIGDDHRLGRPVAVKILHAHVAESPEARERLAREARAIAQLKHENVIEVYDYASDDPDCTWLVTELIDGKSLRQFLDRHPRPMPEVAAMIITELLRALRAAHEVGVIHRDVKPDNILVGKEGRPKLSDFGIAKVLNEAKMTVTGNLVGSPSYMSPEQADGLHTDHRTDLYSAGIVLYRLVTGTLPFRGATPLETIRRVSRGEYQDPVEIAPESSGAIAGIIRRALAVDINERYQTADEMLADLARVLQDAGLSATWEELPKYFADPEGYQAAMRPRLLKELEARGRALLDAGEEARALDCLNRAMSLGDGNQRTLDLVKELSKRRGRGRFRRILAAGGLALGAAFGVVTVVVVSDLFAPEKQPVPAMAARDSAPTEVAPEPEAEVEVTTKVTPPPVEEEPAEVAAPVEVEKAGKVEEPLAESKAKVERKVEVKRLRRPEAEAPVEAPAPVEPPPAEPPPPPPPVVEAPKIGSLQVGTRVWVDVYVDDQKVGRAPDRSVYPLAVGEHRLRAIKPDSNCLPFEHAFTIRPGETTRLRVELVCP